MGRRVAAGKDRVAGSAMMVGGAFCGLLGGMLLTWTTGASKGDPHKPFERPEFWIPLMLLVAGGAAVSFAVAGLARFVESRRK